MPLTAVSAGQQAQSAQLNQLINLLTGVLNDQSVTLKADNTRAGSQLNLDTVNATQQAAAIFKDAGTTKWQLGKNTDNSFFLYDYVRAANALTFVQNGALTITPPTTISGLLTASGGVSGNLTGTVLTAAQPNITSLGTLTSLTVSGTISGNVSGNLTGTVLTAAQPNITSLGTLTGLTVSGTSNFADSSFIMSATGTAYTSATIQARSNQGATVPVRLAFHMSGVVAAQIGMDSTGLIRTYDNPGTGYAPFAASSGSFLGSLTHVTPWRASAYRAAAYTTVSGTWTVFPFDTSTYDPNGNQTLGAGYRYTIPRTGYYRMQTTITHTNNAASDRKIVSIWVNGLEVRRGFDTSYALSGNPPLTTNMACELRLNVNDYVQVYYWSASAAALTVGSTYCFFDICYSGE